MPFAIIIFIILIVLISMIMFMLGRYRICPSDRMLVVFGNVGTNKKVKCIHGRGEFVLPIIQDYAYLSLTPITINVSLQNSLSKHNTFISISSNFTVAISTDENISVNAAERLLYLSIKDLEDLVKNIISGPLRLILSSLTIEEINKDGEKFLETIKTNVEPELNKIGLNIINIDITEIKSVKAINNDGNQSH